MRDALTNQNDSHHCLNDMLQTMVTTRLALLSALQKAAMNGSISGSAAFLQSQSIRVSLHHALP